MKFSRYLLPIFLFLLAYACTPDDDFITDSTATLEFSSDTLTFDTVFTAIGSATRILKIYNPHSRPILIDRIGIRGASTTSFRINIDGDPVNETTDVEIPANDSIYIFGEVTVDPDAPISVSPFVINDYIDFETNGNEQTVVLEAWGQNANYRPNRFSADSITTVGCGGGEVIWDDPKPYVIYGIVFIDECTLVIPAGAEIYVHGGLGAVFNADGNRIFYNDGRLVFGPNASLRVEGTPDNPVTFQGDRLEDDFGDVSGQWYGLIFTPGCQGNEISNAIIKNSVVGVAVDSLADLNIENSSIYNTTANAIFARHSSVNATNCLFYNNASNSVRMLQGGDYNFDYCTITSYGVDASALSLSNVRCLDPFCAERFENDLTASFTNCIITGSQTDQINLVDLSETASFDYSFTNCLVRVEDLLEADAYPEFLNDCGNCINNTDRALPLFVDIDEGDFHLDTLSIVENMGIPIMGIDKDLDQVDRDPVTPDIGSYEYIFQ